jgi:hypothetical protein
MERCAVCGRDFDPFGFQVVVPELGRSFDRVECARQARGGVRVLPAAAPAAPAPVAVTPFERAPAGPAAVLAARRPLLVGANLGLLAAGAAASVYLWLNVLGADPSGLRLGALGAPPAFGDRTVEAAPAATGQGGSPGDTARRAAGERTPAQAPDLTAGQVLAAVTTTSGGAGPGGSGSRTGTSSTPTGSESPSKTRDDAGKATTTTHGRRAKPKTQHGQAAAHPPAHSHASHAHASTPNAHAIAHTRGRGKKTGHEKHHH